MVFPPGDLLGQAASTWVGGETLRVTRFLILYTQAWFQEARSHQASQEPPYSFWINQAGPKLIALGLGEAAEGIGA